MSDSKKKKILASFEYAATQTHLIGNHQSVHVVSCTHAGKEDMILVSRMQRYAKYLF